MYMGFPGGSSSKESPISAGDIEDLRSRGQENPLQKGMTIHSSILTWKIQWTEESSKIWSMGFKELDMTEAT